MVVVDMTLFREEVNFCKTDETTNVTLLRRFEGSLNQNELSVHDSSHVTFHGSRQRSKFSFCQKMYAEEVKEWLEKADAEDRRQMHLREIPQEESPHDRFERERRRRMSCSY